MLNEYLERLNQLSPDLNPMKNLPKALMSAGNVNCSVKWGYEQVFHQTRVECFSLTYNFLKK